MDVIFGFDYVSIIKVLGLFVGALRSLQATC
jgi:hypothetical protein